MCVGVTLWFGCGGVLSLSRLKHYCSSASACTLCGLTQKPSQCAGRSTTAVVLQPAHCAGVPKSPHSDHNTVNKAVQNNSANIQKVHTTTL